MDGADPAVSLPSYPTLPPSLGSSEGESPSPSVGMHFDPYSSMSLDAAMSAVGDRPPLVTQSSDDDLPPSPLPPHVPPRSPLSHPPPPPPSSPPSLHTPHSPQPPPLLQQQQQTNPVPIPQGLPPQAAVPGVSQSSLETGNLALRLQYVEHLCGSLQREKKQLDESFGRQRKQFMKSLLQNDAELQLAKQSVEKFSKQVQVLDRQLEEKDFELKNVMAATRLSASSTREEFDIDRVKYEEEIASLRQIMEGQLR